MCIIIYRKAGAKLTRRQLANSWRNNPDGAGLMYASKGVLVIKKELKSFRRFYDLYREHNKDQNMVLHFRLGNRGTLDTSNLHPHVVNKDLAFVHNGTIMDMPRDDKKSDTVLFNEKILKTLPEGWQTNKAVRTMMASYIGHSKLVFMRSNDVVFMVNGGKGHWNLEKNLWFSNYSYTQNTVTKWSGYSYENKGYTPNKTSSAKGGLSKGFTINGRYYASMDAYDNEIKTLVGVKNVKDDTYDPYLDYGNCTDCGIELLKHEEQYGICDGCATSAAYKKALS